MSTAEFKIPDDRTAETEVSFHDGGQSCKALEINLSRSKFARKYSAYGLVSGDLELLLKGAIQLGKNVDAFERGQHTAPTAGNVA
jgi:hypothetical protein